MLKMAATSRGGVPPLSSFIAAASFSAVRSREYGRIPGAALNYCTWTNHPIAVHVQNRQRWCDYRSRQPARDAFSVLFLLAQNVSDLSAKLFSRVRLCNKIDPAVGVKAVQGGIVGVIGGEQHR